MSVGKMRLFLFLLLLPAMATAATRPSIQVPGKSLASREAPRELRQQKNPPPMHPPAPTNHFANPPLLLPAWKI